MGKMLAEPELKDQDEELHDLLSSGVKIERKILGASITMSRLLAAFLKLKIVTLEGAQSAMWFDRIPEQRPTVKNVHVYMYHLRAWLKERGVPMLHEQRVGWWLDDEGKRKINAIIEAGHDKGPGRMARPGDGMRVIARAIPEKTLSVVWPKYKIEKNIPLPGRGAGYPLDQMEVGDSFLDKKAKGTASAHGTIKSWYQFNKNNEKGAWRFTTRKTAEGVRVWRIK